ncbi:M20/M25/M40 family metallo-hydrolase [Eubacteriales bacterium OttesenSCG-928-G02]|nr:M20/M25/M40 family metallo-hydrolase [Eubacteriales bacterium OttesenSCG-928-G02]
MINLIKKYTSAFSVSGFEGNLADIIISDVKPYADKVYTDPMGNVIAFKKGKDSTKRIMYAAHMDEIGFVVTHIDEKGFIRVDKVGGINAIASSYNEVVFQNGTKGVIIIEEQTKAADITVKKFVVDIGAKTKSQAEKKVSIGDFLSLSQRFTKLQNGRYAAKAFDDRIGCAILTYALMQTTAFAYDTYYVYTVQEELGCRGSKAASNAILPTYGIATDITPANDVPGAITGNIKLGGGAAIKLKDNSVICSRLIIDTLTSLAEKHKIKYQNEVLTFGGTDTSSMQIAGAGAYAGCISLPVRNTHTPVETFDINDFKSCVELFKRITEEGINKI